ncbi:hypothetical protein DID78_02310 [Candidatus Marinamargulisbacteria bacterium SCGC AG-343-D04]|nr:hypothetical protein DID78_02310 [Candidatus Marinamargulisbacteria bacterium SCGC AG-343-D04]
MKRLFLCVLMLCLLAGCVQDNRDDRVIEKSHERKPKWVQHTVLESKHYIYFIQSVRSGLHSPRFAYKASIRQLHAYMKEEVNALYLPMKEVVGQDTYAKETVQFYNVVSTDIMSQIRDEKAIYYEVVQVNYNERIQNQYDYTVAIRLRKKAFRSAQKRFLIRQRHIAKLSNKTLLHQSINKIIEDLEQIRDEEHLKSQSLKENLVNFD